jgi:hypothetical protein
MKYTSHKCKDSGITSLNICTWNVGGLIKDGKHKLNDHSFLTQIKIYDIVLLSETHIGYDTAVESDKFLLAPQSSPFFIKRKYQYYRKNRTRHCK